MNVLVVEDEEKFRKVLQEKLERSGFETMAAKDGDEGWEMAKNSKPDIILSDLIMPKRSGFDLLSKLKKDFDLRNVPVIILSNLADDEELKKVLQMGAADYFVKSQHTIEEVVDKVRQYVGGGEERRTIVPTSNPERTVPLEMKQAGTGRVEKKSTEELEKEKNE